MKVFSNNFLVATDDGKTRMKLSDECECGNAKKKTVQICDRCRSLDGANTSQYDLIMSLRVLGISTITAISEYTGKSRHCLQIQLNRLLKKGKIKRIIPESISAKQEEFYWTI